MIDGFWMLASFLITASFVNRIPRDLTILVQALGVLLLIAAAALCCGWCCANRTPTRC